MADNLLGQRFADARNNPAWHGKGDLNVKGTAVEVLKGWGEYEITKVPLTYTMPSGEVVESGFYSLLRAPIKEDPKYAVLGTPVSGDYEVVTPMTAATLWDNALKDAKGEPVLIETMGMLGKGDRMFITTLLPYEYDVKGDAMKTYLFFDVPFHNGVSIGGYTTPVRVVCQNTVNLGIQAAIQQFAINHTTGAAERAAKWTGGMYARSLEAAKILAEAMNVLAKKKLNDVQVKWIVEKAYPLPNPIVEDTGAATLPLDIRQIRRDNKILRMKLAQETVIRLFNGDMTGFTKAVKGTGFGIVNAASEFEMCRRGTLDQAIGGMINGDRAARLHNVFTLAMNADRMDTFNLGALRQPEPEAVTL